MRIIFKLVLIVALLSACSPSKKELVGTHNYENKEFTITVRVYDSRIQLNREVHGVFPEYKDKELEGLALWSITKDMKEMDRCTVYVVRPDHADDEVEMVTWGHELVHCIYGTFH